MQYMHNYNCVTKIHFLKEHGCETKTKKKFGKVFYNFVIFTF